MEGYNTLQDIDFLQFLGNQESQSIIKPSEVRDEVVSRFNGEYSISGELLPWPKTHNCVGIRPGEVSIWGGYNGHGKSQISGMAIAWFTKQSRCLIASLEMKPSATIYRMTRQVAGLREPADDYRDKVLSWLEPNLWIYDQTDTVKPERILGMIHYAAQILKIKHIVIDSLMKCGIGRDAYDKQAEFVDRLCWAAKHHDTHIHLVAHMRKGEGNKGEYYPPGKHDFRGAGEITDMVDNVFIVHRNKKKEDDIRNGKAVAEDVPDCTLRVAKQRHGEWEGVFNFWFHGDSMQYTPEPGRRLSFKEAI